MIRAMTGLSGFVTKLLCKIGLHDEVESCRNGGIIPTVKICIWCKNERNLND